MSKKRISTASAKNKGRRLQQAVRDKLLEVFNQFEEDDIKSIGMGQSGCDIELSPLARKTIPVSFECKNQESFSIWGAMKQAEDNTKPGTVPVTVFKRNRSETYACMKFEDFIKLLESADKETLREIINESNA